MCSFKGTPYVSQLFLVWKRFDWKTSLNAVQLHLRNRLHLVLGHIFHQLDGLFRDTDEEKYAKHFKTSLPRSARRVTGKLHIFTPLLILAKDNEEVLVSGISSLMRSLLNKHWNGSVKITCLTLAKINNSAGAIPFLSLGHRL